MNGVTGSGIETSGKGDKYQQFHCKMNGDTPQPQREKRGVKTSNGPRAPGYVGGHISAAAASKGGRPPSNPGPGMAHRGSHGPSSTSGNVETSQVSHRPQGTSSVVAQHHQQQQLPPPQQQHSHQQQWLSQTTATMAHIPQQPTIQSLSNVVAVSPSLSQTRISGPHQYKSPYVTQAQPTLGASVTHVQSKSPVSTSATPVASNQNTGGGPRHSSHPGPSSSANSCKNAPPRSSHHCGATSPSMSGGGSSQEQLSKTNLYIRGLGEDATDKYLYDLFKKFGKITSTKAILDKDTGKCKGYGFVDFESPASAEKAIKMLSGRPVNGQELQIQVQMARQKEQDPTNLYIRNLPVQYTDDDLQSLVSNYGRVISVRILREKNSQSKGIGFARMESKEKCEQFIQHYNNKCLPGGLEPLVVKFADSGSKKKTQVRPRESAWEGHDPNLYESHLSHFIPHQNGGLVSSMSQGPTQIRPYSIPQHTYPVMNPGLYIQPSLDHLVPTAAQLEPNQHFQPMLQVNATPQLAHLSLPSVPSGYLPQYVPAPIYFDESGSVASIAHNSEEFVPYAPK